MLLPENFTPTKTSWHFPKIDPGIPRYSELYLVILKLPLIAAIERFHMKLFYKKLYDHCRGLNQIRLCGEVASDLELGVCFPWALQFL